MSTPRVPATRLLHQPSGVSTQEPLQPSPRRVSGIRRIRLETSHGRQSELPTSSGLITYCTQGNSRQSDPAAWHWNRHRWSPNGVLVTPARYYSHDLEQNATRRSHGRGFHMDCPTTEDILFVFSQLVTRETEL